MNDRVPCPLCHSSATAPIIYGMATPEMRVEEQRHMLKIGGCDLSESDPVLYCFTCGHKWGKMADAYPEMFRDFE